jgi:tetratricopeptide (TPR) repeat protein
MRRAVSLHQIGRFELAEQAYQDVLAVDPLQGDAYRLLGGLYLQHDQHEKALQMLQQAAPLRPDQPEIPNNIGIAYQNLGRLNDAIASFEQALKMKPDYAEGLNNLAHALHGLGLPSAAVVLFDKALTIKPDYLKAFCNLAAALRDLGRLNEAALRLQSAMKIIPNDADLFHEYGITLQQLNRLPEALKSFEQGLHLRPDHFASLSNYGSTLRDVGRIDEALAIYERALKLAPHRPEVFVNLGAVFWDMAQLDRAIECYDQALALKPDYVEAMVNLGNVLWAQGQSDAAREKYIQALKIKPDSVSVYSNLAALRHDVADLDGALELYEKALRIDPMHPEARFGRGIALLAYGQYREGWMLYESGLGRRVMRGISLYPTKPWNGIAAPTKRLVILSEQGLGDVLQFVRYAALCRERMGKVIVLCPEPLVRLLAGCDGVDDVRSTIDADQFDEHISILSLPYVFGTTLESIPANIPYLKVKPELAKKWSPQLVNLPGLKVGLVWAGSTREGQVNAHMLDRRRSLHLKQLLPLLDVPGVSFVNLQLGKPRGQMAELKLQSRLTDIMDGVNDFADTAAIINSLDLVITVDTSVAHVAGGLGKPVWIMSRYDACWRWLRNREDSPWYPSARIFGQPSMGDWDAVVTKVREALHLAANP